MIKGKGLDLLKSMVTRTKICVIIIKGESEKWIYQEFDIGYLVKLNTKFSSEFSDSRTKRGTLVIVKLEKVYS